MIATLKLSHFCLSLTILVSVTSLPLYTSDYLLLPSNSHVMIPISNSLLLKSNNGTMQYLKATVKIQVRAANGTYIDSPFESGNIMVKYWKNQGNTPATQILSYSYETISKSRKILTATDPSDQGLYDIEALHNYQNEHNFMHSYGNQSSDVLFVLGIYRFGDKNLTNLLGMTKISDQIKISVSIFKATPAELRCAFCSVKTFCPTNQCECYQEIYSDCQVKKKSIIAKTDRNSKTTESLTLQVGTLSFIQIEPNNATNDSYLTKILLEFDNTDPSKGMQINKDRIFFLIFTQNKTDPSYMIPNIYNYDSINSPSFSSKIASPSLKQFDVSALAGASSYYQGIHLYEQVSLDKNEILTMAIYYLNGTASSLVSDVAVTNAADGDLNVSMEMTFTDQVSELVQGTINIGLIIGMIAAGFFLLLLLICVLHFLVAKRFSIFTIFFNSESSNRTSILTGRSRSRRISNMSQQASTLPQIPFAFMKHLIFRPLKFIYSPHLQQKHSTNKPTQKVNSHDQLCSICLQQFSPQSLVKYTYCGHILDSKCISEWFKKEESCPLCRQKLETEDIGEYEGRIMEEVWENQYYQGVLDEEVGVLKRVYREWEEGKLRGKRERQEGMRCTEESLVDNNFGSSNKYIQNAIHNISTLQQLEKSQTPIVVKASNRASSPNTQNNNNHNNSNHHNEHSTCHKLHSSHILPNLPTNHSQLHQPSPQSITLQSLPWLIPVLQASTSVSFKRFIKIYRFYRCIYLYHQINKKFQKDQNLYEPSICLEEKECGENLHEGIVKTKPQLVIESGIDHAALYVTSRKHLVRQRQQQDQNDRYNFQQNPNDNHNESHEVQTNFNSQHKLPSTLSFKKIRNNKHGRAAFHLDFQFNQHQLSITLPQHHANQYTLQQPPKSNNPIMIMEENQGPGLFRQPTDSSQQSNAIKLAQRGKCLSMREEMDGLERDFAQRKRSEDMNEDVRFREHEGMFGQEDGEEGIENQRYVDERYLDVMEPVEMSQKMTIKREPTNMSNIRQPTNRSNLRQPTNRSNHTQSMHLSRGTFSSQQQQDKTSSLSNHSKKPQSPPENNNN